MREVATMTIDVRLQRAFSLYQQNSTWRFQVELRRVRAEQIRHILTNSASVTLDTFNRDVWAIESETKLDGQPITHEVLDAERLSPERSAELKQALESGRLELHGNYTWGTASRIYGPMLALDDATKVAHVHRALTILNDVSLSPLQKAQQIGAIPGFGPNISTGMIMLYHPDAFAIMNTKSRDALQKLGYDVGSQNDLEQFERSAMELRAQLGAQDFLELDYFLYLIATGEIVLTPRVVKIAPGDKGRFWDDCLEGGYICVGWDDVDDLTHYSSAELFKQRFTQLYGTEYNNPSKTSAKANEVWRLMELRPGDQIIANRGTSEVLGVGTVMQPGYRWRPDRGEYKHTVTVRWDPSVAKHIPEQKDWAFKTVADIPSKTLAEVFPEVCERIVNPPPPPPPSAPHPRPVPLTFDDLSRAVHDEGLRIDERTLRRYHLALHTRGFVILSGLSGAGKTWLAEAYARATRAEYLIVSVAPNWTTNEDLLGYFNPIDNAYHDTEFSRFLRRAAQAYQQAQTEGHQPVPYHLILDEMNLARVEYYFARFLSAMETRARNGLTTIELGPHEQVILPPNLYFVGTVNVDETTHGFADKVYDRAQLIELDVSREALADHLGSMLYRETVLHVWDTLHNVAPFAFRVVDEMKVYIAQAEALGVLWTDALDEQLLQKVLPKCTGADLRLGPALQAFVELTHDRFPLSAAKASEMLNGYQRHGFASYF